MSARMAWNPRVRAGAWTVLLLAQLACRPADGTPDPLARQATQPEETLSSLDVEVRFDPGGAGCVSLDSSGRLPPLSVAGDFCPAGPGTPAEPLPYQTGRRVRIIVNLIAIGTQGTYRFPVTGNIALSMTGGQIFSGTPTRLTDGATDGQRVVFLNGPGRVQLWAEASTLLRLGDRELKPTFSLGSTTPLFFEGPTVEDIQRTDDDSTNVLYGQRVEVRSDNLVVTRITGNGFVVQDMAAPRENGLPTWDAMFVFAFNGVNNLRVGSRLLRLRGALTEFQGMTQLAEPEYLTAGAPCAPKLESSLYGLEPQETEEGGQAYKARCPDTAECRDDVCVPRGDTRHYDAFGRVTCSVAETCGGSSSQCPSGMACMDRVDWNTTGADGNPAFTCQACPVAIPSAYWTTPGRTPGYCGPIYNRDEDKPLRMRNEALEAALVELKDVRVDGLDLGNDFFRSGFEGFGQWKVRFADEACATVTSVDAYPAYPVVEKDMVEQPLRSFVGTFRQVRFNSGSAFWMVDLRHREDLVEATTP